MFYPRCNNPDRKNWGNLLDQFAVGRILSTVSIGGTNIEARVKSVNDHDGYSKVGSAVTVMLKYTLAALLVTSCECHCAIISSSSIHHHINFSD